MRSLATLVGMVGLMAPTAASAEVSLILRARIEPQCKVISISSVAGSTDIAIRTACNVERYTLTLADADSGQVSAVSAQNAAVVASASGALNVSVENPGFQTVTVTLDAPVDAEPPVFTLNAA